MGTCTCTQRDFRGPPFSSQESLLTPYEASLGISVHTVTNLVAGLNEVAVGGYISRVKLQVYLRIFELNLGLGDDQERPKGKLLREFEKREGFNQEKLIDLMVLLGKGKDTLKADALFWSRCKGQELAKSDVHGLLQSLTHLAYSVLPQLALDSMRSTSPESTLSALQNDITLLTSVRDKVVTYWEEKLMAGEETVTYAQFRSGFGESQCKALCKSSNLRQFGREVDKLLTTP